MSELPGKPEEGAPTRMFDILSNICLYVAAFMLAAIVVINGVNVFCRYVLFWAISWAEEAMVYLMIASVFIGAIPVTWQRTHIRIDALIQRFGKRMQIVLEAFAILITAAVLLPIGWLSIGVISKLRMFDQRSDALDLPVWIPQTVVPFALVLIPVIMVFALKRDAGGPHDNVGN